ncbi:MAG: NusG domain II-containing protein [Clostridia bacterium]|nr:NusG domain II-containing protein [Clostridia bacterium]
MSESKKRIIRNDIIIILIPLVIAALLLVLFQTFSKKGSLVLIEQDGKEIGRYELSKDLHIPIKGSNGQTLLILNIENESAFVSDSKCTDATCERTGRISRIGESIVCLPSRVMIKIVGDSSENRPNLPDAVAFYENGVRRQL